MNREKLAREIKLRQTFQCPTCGDFEYPQEGYSERAPCPTCGISSARLRVSSREKSVLAYVLSITPEYLKVKFKAPLQKSLILFANRLDFELSKENTNYPNTHLFLNLAGRLYQHYSNPSKNEMTEAALKILIFEIEHDRHYRMILYWLVQELVKEVLKGNWKLIEKSDIGTEWEFWNIPLEDSGGLRDMLDKIRGVIKC